MSASTPNPVHSVPISWGMGIAAASLLLIGGGAIVWSNRADEPTTSPPRQAGDMPDVVTMTRRLPEPPPVTNGLAHGGLHTIAYAIENGVRVVKIKVVETGDELIVDAATGRLLESRPSRPTGPPPMGKFAAPFDPMT